jgi:hypothetical protein
MTSFFPMRREKRKAADDKCKRAPGTTAGPVQL